MPIARCALLLVLLAPVGAAWGDIAPTPQNASSVPGPFSDLPDLSVQMASEEVTLDIYPTVAVVNARFVLKGGEDDVRNLKVGFPELLTGVNVAYGMLLGESSADLAEAKARDRLEFVLPGSPPWREFGEVAQMPLHEFSVTVEGVAVEARRERIDRERPSRRKSVRSVWWLFEMDVPAGSTRVVELRYVQPLAGFYRGSAPGGGRMSCAFSVPGRGKEAVSVPVRYILTTGSLWQGPIGHARLEVRLHGLERASVCASLEPEFRSDGSFRIERRDWEPDEDLEVRLIFNRREVEAMRSGPPPYDLSTLSPLWEVNDRLVRFNRSFELGTFAGCADEKAEKARRDEWSDLVDYLQERAWGSDGPEAAILARTILGAFVEQTCPEELGRDWDFCTRWLSPPEEPLDEPAFEVRLHLWHYTKGVCCSSPGPVLYFHGGKTLPLWLVALERRQRRQRLVRWSAWSAGLVLLALAGVFLYRWRRPKAAAD